MESEQKKRGREMAVRTRKVGANRRFFTAVQHTVGRVILKRFRVRTENLELLTRTPPPFLILANHVSNWDPLFLSSLAPQPVHHVTSDAQFRNPLMEKVLYLLGSIPKSKSRSDLDAVKSIFRIRETGGIIGLFPEGQRTWNGETLPILYPTAKLLKTLKIPVITAVIQGAYLSAPRWGRRRRLGPVSIRFGKGPDPEELRELDVPSLHRRMTELLEYNEFENQRQTETVFRSLAGAEYLERALFLCPQCRSLGTLRSSRGSFRCGSCGYGVRFTSRGLFTPLGEAAIFPDIALWDRWQRTEFRKMLQTMDRRESREPGTGEEAPFFFEDRIRLRTLGKTGRMKNLGTGRAGIRGGQVELVFSRGGTLNFPLARMDGINVQTGERLEFYQENQLFQFKFTSPRSSAYKWLLALQFLKEESA